MLGRQEDHVFAARVETERGDVLRIYAFDRFNHTAFQLDAIVLNDTLFVHPRCSTRSRNRSTGTGGRTRGSVSPRRISTASPPRGGWAAASSLRLRTLSTRARSARCARAPGHITTRSERFPPRTSVHVRNPLTTKAHRSVLLQRVGCLDPRSRLVSRERRLGPGHVVDVRLSNRRTFDLP